MRIAFFDTIGGISGDMVLGSFISAGISTDDLFQEFSKLNIQGAEIATSRVERSGISAVKVDVIVSAKQEHHRGIPEIFSIIDASKLRAQVKEVAKKIFHELARAEAVVHNKSIEKITFHEIGAIDSIVDIVGVSICLDKLGIESVYSSPVKLGSGGFVKTEHGQLPLPVPAVTEILRGYPTILTDIPKELTTPTGAAIIKATSVGILSTERIRVEKIGYGAGSMDIQQLPNLLRLMVGDLIAATSEDEVVVIETEIDNMNPEIYPFLIERLLEHGACDAYLIPVIMKKGRPGIVISVLVPRVKLDEIVNIIFKETSTIGVRLLPVERRKIFRAQKEVMSKLGIVKMKVVEYNGRERFLPEFEECKRISLERNIPLRDVYQMLNSEFNKV